MSEVNFLIQFNMSRYSESLSKFYRSQYERTRDDFNSLWGIRLPNISDAQSFINKANPATNLDVVSDIRCLGVHGPLQIKNLDIPGEIDLYKTVDKNFVRTEYVRNTADRLSDNICLGKPYVCIHWRNRTGEICEFNLLLNGAENCPHTMPLLSGSSNKTAQAVRDFMQSKRIKCAYVAAPPRQQEFIDDLRSEQQLQVFTSKKIISMKDKDARRLRIAGVYKLWKIKLVNFY
ncbi:uncharacterized protein LOC100374416 isoform X2 [Saccoglossus kowalevskii]|uniref:Uncharacterized protein LOC100374416 n=1 Tax=Saccoglossus kowalevskii TaxID=10224 RepID=A0ABM0GNN9_SACKO|nr:PREDICTED: uncharacterized protein LOC100374416 [Saccoglossus kowalevskii]